MGAHEIQELVVSRFLPTRVILTAMSKLRQQGLKYRRASANKQ